VCRSPPPPPPLPYTTLFRSVRARQIPGGSDERVVVQNIEDTGHRKQHVVLTDLGIRPAVTATTTTAATVPVTTAASATPVLVALLPIVLLPIVLLTAILLPVALLPIVLSGRSLRDVALLRRGLAGTLVPVRVSGAIATAPTPT